MHNICLTYVYISYDTQVYITRIVHMHNGPERPPTTALSNEIPGYLIQGNR